MPLYVHPCIVNYDLADCVSFIFSQVWSSRYYIVNIIQQSIIVPIMKYLGMQLRWVDLLWDLHIFIPCATVDLCKIQLAVRHCNLPEDKFNKPTFIWNKHLPTFACAVTCTSLRVLVLCLCFVQPCIINYDLRIAFRSYFHKYDQCRYYIL